MNRIEVSSSNVLEVGYDSESVTLEVMFKGGMVYQYFDVPEHHYHGLLSADSVGRYLNENIKGIFRFARL